MSELIQIGKNPWQRVLNVVIWSALFAIAYSQSPLYTSNQNQYFLHGLARGGRGTLQSDWLANTRDSTPVFSLLVELTYRYFQHEVLFYLYYAALMGLYLFCLYGIASTLFNINSSKSESLFFLAVLITIHSAGLRFALSRVVGVNWAYVLEDGVADQRILGPVFQPSTFGVFLILSIYLFLKQYPFSAILVASLAAIVHPTYLLAAAALTISYMLITWLEERQIKKCILLGLLSLIAVMPIILYSWGTFVGGAPEAISRARQILVDFRIPHHAKIGQWFDATVVAKLLIITLSLYLARGKRIFGVLLVSGLFALTLTLLQAISNNSALALIFPWRISTYLLPIATTICCAMILDRLFDLPWLKSPQRQKVIELIAILMIILSVLVGGIRFWLDQDRKIEAPERTMEAYVDAHHSSEDVYLIPVKLQDFRLAAGTPAYVDFKSIPYQDMDVLEWYRRVKLADLFYQTHDCNVLASMVDHDGITHVLIEMDQPLLRCDKLAKVYRDPYYRIYQTLP
ncbi:MAG: hypothetical protein A2W33_09700 [Chloroflexi bacterium RBG_16_52_11]|nr:MAG: hypothetical protein A2W33_09700 [Chloroflexi bacterium RBG_16_52_11]